MFREMRRKRQQLPEDESLLILEQMTNGVLAVQGDEGYPYAVPISYVYVDGHIYMHSAVAGHKIDSLCRSEKVSFCVVQNDEVVSEEFTTYFRSVIAFGKAHLVDNADDKLRILRLLASKYSPHESKESVKHEIDKGFDHVSIIDLQIEHLTGKEAIELVRRREK